MNSLNVSDMTFIIFSAALFIVFYFYGNSELLKVNMIAAFSCALYAGVATFIILKIISFVTKLRTDND